MQGARVAGGARLALTRLSVVAHNGGVRAPQEVNDSIACSQKALNETHNPALSNITTVGTEGLSCDALCGPKQSCFHSYPL